MAQCKETVWHCRRPEFDPWVRKIPWRRKRQPTPVFLLEKPRGQRSLADYSPWGCKRVRLDLVTKNNTKQPFLFGCAGSSLLSAGFLQLRRASGGYSLVGVCRLLIEVASLVAEHGLQGARASVVAARRLSSRGAWTQLPQGTWHPPSPGIEPLPSALARQTLNPLDHQGSPSLYFSDTSQTSTSAG